MREEHRLGVLQVGVAGHHNIKVLLSYVNQSTAKGIVALKKVLAKLLGVQANVGCHLIVARAAGVQAGARRANVAGQGTLDGHVDVLVVDVPGKLAALDLAGDVCQARVDGSLVVVANDALLGQHLGVSTAARDVLLGHGLVDLKRRAKLLRKGVDALLKPAAPKSHEAPLSSIQTTARPDSTGRAAHSL